MHDTLRTTDKAYNLFSFEADFRHYLLAVNKLKPVTVKNYISDYVYFAGWVETEAKKLHIIPSASQAEYLAQFTQDVVNAYKQYLVQHKLPYRTINRRLSTLRKFFTFAIEQEWISRNPAKGVRNVSKSKTPRKFRKVGRSNSDIQVLLTSFKADLVTDDIKESNIHACMHDVQEFFDIISSQPYAYEHYN